MAGGISNRLVASVLIFALATPAAGSRWRSLGEGLPTAGQWRQGFDLADLDGDGRLDLVHGPARRGDGLPVIFRGDGKGGFARWQAARFPELALDYGAAIAADFSGDGRMDLAFGAHLRGLTVLRNEGDGSFGRWDEGMRLDSSGDAFSSRALAAVDWNGDGRRDLAALGEGPSPGTEAREGSYGLRLLLNGGDGSWKELAAVPAGRLFGYSLAVGDFDGDGESDVVTSSRSQGRLEVIHSRTSDGGIVGKPLAGARPGSVLHAVAALDPGGAGADRIVASVLARGSTGEWRGHIDVYDASGGRREVLALDEAIEISVVATGDLDGDGLADLVAAGVGGRVWVFLGRAGGEFKRVRARAIERSAEGCKASHARLVDLDGEAGDELVISFSGEPREGGVCPRGGSIQVWKAR